MKHLKTHLSILALLLLATSTHAQTADPVCDTLVLNNGRVLSVTIDSIVGSTFLYKICASDNPNQYRLDVAMIRNQIIHSKVVRRSAPAASSAFPKMRPLKKWVFKHQIKKISSTLSEEQEITVQYADENWSSTRRVNGRLRQLSPKSLQLQTSPGKYLDIDTQYIYSISYRKGNLNKVLGFIFLVGGLLLFLVLRQVYAVNALFSLIGGGSAGSGAILLLPMIIALFGLVLLLLPNKEKIDRPFSTEWEIYEGSAEGQTELPFVIPDNQKLP